MNIKTQVSKNGTRSRQRPQSRIKRKPASVESPAADAKQAGRLRGQHIRVMADMHGSHAAQCEFLNHILQAGEPEVKIKANELIGLLDEFNWACSPEELTDAALAERRTEINSLTAQPPRLAAGTLVGTAIKAMTRLIGAQQRAGAILLLSAGKFLEFASDEGEAPPEDIHLADGLRAAARTGNEELQALIIQAETVRSAMDAHTATSDDLHKCLGDCEFKCDEMAQLLELISHTRHETAKARVSEDRMLRGEGARRMREEGISCELALEWQQPESKHDLDAASMFSLITNSAADELREAWDAAWQAWVAIKEAAQKVDERRAA